MRNDGKAGGPTQSTMPRNAARKLVGSPVPPRDAQHIVLGQGKFIGDVKRAHMLHVAFLRSPHAHARILGIDTTLAQALDGVVTVATSADIDWVAPFRSLPNRFSGGGETVQPLLAEGKVRYVGEPICAVVAVDRATAEDAIGLIEVSYEPLPPVVDPLRATQEGAMLVHEESGSNLLIDRAFEAGDVDGAFAGAAHVLRRDFRLHRKTPLPLEGRGCVASTQEGGYALTVWISHQLPYIVRYYLAQHLGLKEHEIRVVVPDTGGGFGQKASIYTEEFVVAALALRLRRPLKWVEDRLENFVGSSHARDQFIDLEAAVDAEGRLLGLKADVLVDVGAYSIYVWTAGMEPLQTGGLMPGPYRVGSYRYRTQGVATNKTPVGPYRAVGRPTASAALELLFDDIARRLGKDPVEIRRLNLIQSADLPFRNINNLIHDNVVYAEMLEQALELSGYDGLRRDQEELRRQGRLRGIGVVCYAELTGLGTRTPAGPGTSLRAGRDAVTLRLEPSGVLTVLAAMPSQGQRIATGLAQVAADELGMRIEDIKVVLNDTATVPYGFGTFATRTAVLGGGAVILAGQEIRRRIVACAAHLLQMREADLEIVESTVRTTDGTRSMPVSEVARVSFFEAQRLPEEINPGLEVTKFYDPHFGSFAGGAHVVVVDIDAETGVTKVVRYLVVEDCGRIINPAVVEGQIVGGIAQGIGEALLEELVYDETGQLQNATLADYLAPTIEEVPHVEVHHMEALSASVGGFKGVGEGSQIGAVAAICCAVEDALRSRGATLTEFPASGVRVWRALEETKSDPS